MGHGLVSDLYIMTVSFHVRVISLSYIWFEPIVQATCKKDVFCSPNSPTDIFADHIVIIKEQIREPNTILNFHFCADFCNHFS